MASSPKIELADLSRTVSHALRHEPWLYELELDEGGWVKLSSLVDALRDEARWRSIDEGIVREMIERSDKRRHEIKVGRIRAIYGHSLPGRLARTPSAPPPTLYHGTIEKAATSIEADGLKPMRRQYVHLSLDVATAEQVAKRRTLSPVILRINAQQAQREGIRFYVGNENVWLSDEVPPRFVGRAERANRS